MGIGTSDGKYYDSEHEWLLDTPRRSIKDIPDPSAPDTFDQRFNAVDPINNLIDDLKEQGPMIQPGSKTWPGGNVVTLLNKPNIEDQNEIPKASAAPIAQKYMDMPESKNVEDRRKEDQIPVLVDYFSKEYSGFTTSQWKYLFKHLSKGENWFKPLPNNMSPREYLDNLAQQAKDETDTLGNNPLSEKAGFKDIKVK